jgi:hypothetical protein
LEQYIADRIIDVQNYEQHVSSILVFVKRHFVSIEHSVVAHRCLRNKQRLHLVINKSLIVVVVLAVMEEQRVETANLADYVSR